MCGAVIRLSYPVVLAFLCLMWPVTYLRVVVGRFVLKLPLIVHLVLPEFEHFMLEYLIFAVFKSLMLVLGFLVCISLAVVT